MPIETRPNAGISDYETLSGDFSTLSGSVADYPTVSGDFANVSGDFATVSGAYATLSGSVADYPTLSGDFSQVSGNHASVSGDYVTLSGNYAEPIHTYPMSFGVDQKWEGVAMSGIIDDAATAFGDCMYMAADGHWEQAAADSPSTMPCRGMALTGGACTGLVLLHGKLRNDSWAWTMAGGTGLNLYVSGLAGEMTQTPPSSAGDCIQIVGFATTGNEVIFDPDKSYIEHG